MPRRTTAATVAIAAALLLAAAGPGAAQQPSTPTAGQQPAPQESGTVRIGTLRCDVAGDRNFVFGSTRQLVCDFTNLAGRHDRYKGEIRRYGVDLGFLRSGVMLWGVLAPTTDQRPGVLAGDFEGVSAGVTAGVGVGVGANVLVGGSRRSITLQPISIEGNTGLNLALGVARLRLTRA